MALENVPIPDITVYVEPSTEWFVVIRDNSGPEPEIRRWPHSDEKSARDRVESLVRKRLAKRETK